MSITPEQLLASLRNRTITNGWDVVVGIAAQTANQLFSLRFADSLAQGLMNSPLKPINATAVITAGGSATTVQLAAVQLSPPLVSIAPEAAPGQVALAFVLLGGDVVETSQAGSFIAVTTIHPAAEFTLAAEVPLAGVTASGNTAGQVTLDVSDASFNVQRNLSFSSAANAALGQLITAFLQSGVIASFPIATLPTGTAGLLMPVGVSFGTEVVDDGVDAGRLLLFFATGCNPNGGIKPPVVDDGSMLVPSGYAATLVVSSAALMRMVQASLTAALQGAGVTAPSVVVQTGQPFGCVTVNGGVYSATLPPYCWFHQQLNDYETDYYIATVDAAMTFAETGGFTVSFNSSAGDYGALEASMSNEWTQPFSWGGNSDHGNSCNAANMVNSQTESATASVTLAATPLEMQISSTQTSVSFTFAPSFQADFTSQEPWWEQLLVDGFDPSTCLAPLAPPLGSALAKMFAVPLEPLDLFVTLNYLFSADRQMILATGGMPGDLVLFANVQMPAWYLSAPATNTSGIAICRAGDSLQISVVAGAAVSTLTWECSSGQINGTTTSATYEATNLPRQRPLPMTVIVSASDGTASMQLPIIVVPDALIVSPAAATASLQSTITFTAAAAADPAAITWTSSDPASLPIAQPTGMSVQATVPVSLAAPALVTVTATDSSTGLSGSSYVLVYRFLTLDVNLSPGWQEITESTSVEITAAGAPVINWHVYASQQGVATLQTSSGTAAIVAVDASSIVQPVFVYVVAVAESSFPAAIAAIRVLPSSS